MPEYVKRNKKGIWDICNSRELHTLSHLIWMFLPTNDPGSLLLLLFFKDVFI